ncbi:MULTISPECIES: helix-turn-helix domain-containing protein [Glycomyces]|uniref:Helix-turn-helix transcriptional regulator n=2 Tax=Glycomyces TaxID=58113 RepID=A0A9X3PQF2_9ACTN|nr:helix-turn-helix transcriptional regulator [Glycomyces lechevalierae]MDA1387322.1 helix-turn-helix transcriptional regulator [Glycomyces lechevalierae]MDR7340074.1 transcriptional regulator with XRE-family HTH domain [Glycomyces lechevalierae]
MVLLRELLGETLRRRRRAQKRTLRDVSKQANVSLGYLSEIERGHKEPSSELLASVCGALQVRLSEVLAEVSREVAIHERGEETPQGRQVAVLPLRDKEAQEEVLRRRRALSAAPPSIAQVRSRHRRGEVTDSVVRAAA